MVTEHLKDGPVTHNHSKKMVAFAAHCLLAYFKLFGPRRPGEIEDDFCGQPAMFEMMSNIQGRWRESPFYPALGHLVDIDAVYYWKDDEGDWWYDIKIVPNQSLEIDAQKAASDSA